MPRPLTCTAKRRPAVHARLRAFLEPQRLLDNAGLAERRGAYRKARGSVSLYDQPKSRTALRAAPEFCHYALNCQRSCLLTLDRAFKSVFRRVKAGHQPGFPRFKRRARGVRAFATSLPRLQAPGKGHSLSVKGLGRLGFKGQGAGPVVKAREVQTPMRGVGQLVVDLPDVHPNPNPPLGIAVGISARVPLSAGQRWPKNEGARERLTVLPQRLAAAKKGSKPRQERKRQLAKEWQRVRARAIRHEMRTDVVKRTTGYSVDRKSVV